jgi:hypothetical protein
MGIFDDYENAVSQTALNERTTVLRKKASSFDSASANELSLNWNGEYLFRFLPVLDPEKFSDWLTPRGFHWNVWPSGDPDNPYTYIGCPEFTYGEFCPVCHAINTMVRERDARFADFGYNGSGIMVRKQNLSRVLLLEVNNLTKGKGKKNPPEWAEGDLPAIKVIPFPQKVVSDIFAAQENPRIKFIKLTHPKIGRTIQIIRDDTQSDPKNIYQFNVLDEYPIPDEFLTDEMIKAWPDPRGKEFLPQITTEDFRKEMTQHQLDMDPRIFNLGMAINVLPGGSISPELETGAESKEEVADLSELRKKIHSKRT